jgi:BMFP domain-containing protein YqiC
MDARRRLFDDFAKLATSAVGVVQGAGREAEELMRQRLDRLVDRMDLVSREEFEAVKAMAQAAREENERLAARLAALEAAAKPAAKRKAPARKSGPARKAAARKGATKRS